MTQIYLKEGGNVFPDTSPFDQKMIPDILKPLNKVLDTTGAKAIPIGSGATPKPGYSSGDLDVIVDQDAVAAHFNSKDAKTARQDLEALFKQAGFETAKTGVSVHVRVPMGDHAHQVDIMVVPKAENAAKFHTHNIPAGSPYKGVNKQIAMATLAKEKNMLWSPYQGLFNRLPNGKKDPNGFVTDDIDEIAKTLLGSNATAKDLGSVETIVAALGPKGEQLLADLKADPNWKEVAPKAESLADKQLRRIKELSGTGLNSTVMVSGAFNK